jgi:hypothetical protein
VVKATTVAVAIIRLTATARIVLLTQCLLKTIFWSFHWHPLCHYFKGWLVWTRGNRGNESFHCVSFVEPLQ